LFHRFLPHFLAYTAGLTANCSEDDLEDIFSRFGKISEKYIVRSKGGKSRCYGFVTFTTGEAAALATETYNDQSPVTS